MNNDYDELAMTLVETNNCDYSESPEPLEQWIVEDFEDILPNLDFSQ